MRLPRLPAPGRSTGLMAGVGGAGLLAGLLGGALVGLLRAPRHSTR